MRRRRKPLRVKIVDFASLSKDDPWFRGSVGRFNEDTRTVYVDRGLPETANGTRALAVAHEKAHAALRDAGAHLHLTEAQEERLAEILGVMGTPTAFLSITEGLVKAYIRGLPHEQRIQLVLTLAGVSDQNLTKILGDLL